MSTTFAFRLPTGIIDKLRGSRNGPKRGEDPAFMVNAAGTEYDKKNDITSLGEFLGNVNAFQNFTILRCLEKNAANVQSWFGGERVPATGVLSKIKAKGAQAVQGLKKQMEVKWDDPSLTPVRPSVKKPAPAVLGEGGADLFTKGYGEKPPEAKHVLPLSKSEANIERFGEDVPAGKMSRAVGREREKQREKPKRVEKIPMESLSKRIERQGIEGVTAVSKETPGAVPAKVYTPLVQRMAEWTKKKMSQRRIRQLEQNESMSDARKAEHIKKLESDAGPAQREGYIAGSPKGLPEGFKQPDETHEMAVQRIKDLAQRDPKDLSKKEKGWLRDFGKAGKEQYLGLPHVPVVGRALANVEYAGRLVGRTGQAAAQWIGEKGHKLYEKAARPLRMRKIQAVRAMGGHPEAGYIKELTGVDPLQSGIPGVQKEQAAGKVREEAKRTETGIAANRETLMNAAGALINMHRGKTTDSMGKSIGEQEQFETALKAVRGHYPKFEELVSGLNLTPDEEGKLRSFTKFEPYKDDKGNVVTSERQQADALASFEKAHGQLQSEGMAGEEQAKAAKKFKVIAKRIGEGGTPVPEKKPAAAATAAAENVIQNQAPRTGLGGEPAESPEEALKKMWGLGGAAAPTAAPTATPAAEEPSAAGAAGAPRGVSHTQDRLQRLILQNTPEAGQPFPEEKRKQVAEWQKKLVLQKKIDAGLPPEEPGNVLPTGATAGGMEFSSGPGGVNFKQTAGGTPEGAMPFKQGVIPGTMARSIYSTKVQALQGAEYGVYQNWLRRVKGVVPDFEEANPAHVEAALKAVKPTPKEEGVLGKVMDQKPVTPSKMLNVGGTPGVKASPFPSNSQGVAAAAASGKPQDLGNTIHNAANDTMARAGLDASGRPSVLGSGSPQLSQEDIDSIKYISRQRNLAQHPEVLDQFFARFGGSRPPSPLIQGLISTGGMLAGMSMMEAAGFTGALPQLMAMGLGPAVASWLAEKFGYGSDKYNQIVEAYLSGKTPQSLAESYQQPQGIGSKIKSAAGRFFGGGAPAAKAPAVLAPAHG